MHTRITTRTSITLTTAAGMALALASAHAMAQSDPLDAPFVSAQRFTSLLADGRAWRVEGRQVEGDLGKSVSAAGDVNGDGVDDLILGANAVDGGGRTRAGEAYVVFGAVGGPPAIGSVADLDGQNGFTFRGGTANDRLGVVAGAGDVNGDGMADIIIGAPQADAGGPESGESYVVFGRAGGFPAVMTPDDLDGTNGFRVPGQPTDHRNGSALAGVGDVNADGIDDLAIGAVGDAGAAGNADVAYVVFGRRDGFPAEFDLAGLDGTNGFRFGRNSTSVYEVHVAGAGDVDGDGINDVLVGVPWASSAYLIYGREDGFPAALAADELDGTNGFAIESGGGFDLSGRTVSSAGDLNGDGLDDIAIGAPYAGRNGDGIHYQGYAYVLFGKGDRDEPLVVLADLDGTDGFRMEGATRNDLTGQSLAAVGDVNGDGFDDLAVGTPGTGYSYTCYYCGGSDADGAAYVIYGRDSGFDAVIDLTDVSSDSLVRFDGPSRSFMASSMAGGGDFNGDGRPDIVLGAPGGWMRPSSGGGLVIYGRGEVCAADIDGDGELTLFDFLEFQNLFDAGDPLADFDGDGELTLFDFLAFQNAFDAGCP
ncbi:MAG: GC-type dockerin domain-anchored protein [Phycisphaerales bacterium JB060]